jgi:hypothetical protein
VSFIMAKLGRVAPFMLHLFAAAAETRSITERTEAALPVEGARRTLAALAPQPREG